MLLYILGPQYGDSDFSDVDYIDVEHAAYKMGWDEVIFSHSIYTSLPINKALAIDIAIITQADAVYVLSPLTSEKSLAELEYASTARIPLAFSLEKLEQIYNEASKGEWHQIYTTCEN